MQNRSLSTFTLLQSARIL